MPNRQQFSNVTKNYLSRFYEILDEMILNMMEAELTDSISHNFIVQMIPHHRAAIGMSRNILQYTTDVPLQAIASNIITEQTKSIATMQRILDQCSTLKNDQQDLRLYQRRTDLIMQAMFSEMEQAASTNNINADFIREMIPHHRGAVRMSQHALHFPVCPELVPILQAIIVSQLEGIREMELLLRQMGNT
ncbi:DUF305 domain-containing protein [Butyricicoccus sp.]|uniref:DUF305 domain-containing protein n=1 Tax=Butyricicoccus sp. TaxID=2049021 RepID=UPI003F1622DF